MFENLVNYDKSKTISNSGWSEDGFENLVNYDKSKTEINKRFGCNHCLRTL